MADVISFKDSYGQPREYPRTPEALGALKSRRIEYVVPEVLEVLDRIKQRHLTQPAYVAPEAVALELGIRVGVIKNIFQQLIRTRLLGVAVPSKRHPIHRKVEEGDYSII